MHAWQSQSGQLRPTSNVDTAEIRIFILPLLLAVDVQLKFKPKTI
jgi:hypothetical protein